MALCTLTAPAAARTITATDFQNRGRAVMEFSDRLFELGINQAVLEVFDAHGITGDRLHALVALFTPHHVEH